MIEYLVCSSVGSYAPWPMPKLPGCWVYARINECASAFDQHISFFALFY